MIISKLKDYLFKIFAELEEVNVLNETDLVALPLFIRKNNNFYNTTILDVEMILVELHHVENTPSQLGKEYNLLRNQLISR